VNRREVVLFTCVLIVILIAVTTSMLHAPEQTYATDPTSTSTSTVMPTEEPYGTGTPLTPLFTPRPIPSIAYPNATFWASTSTPVDTPATEPPTPDDP
jgi:hypothetical protein